MSSKLRVFTAFSGYDSQCLALDRLGVDYELIGWAEIDKYAIQAHNALYPQWADRNFGDISKIDWSQVPDFDLFTYSSPCFVAGTLITTDKGLKKIEDIKGGDMVLTHTGGYQKVITPMKRNYFGLLYEISSIFGDVTCTPEHPFYTSLCNIIHVTKGFLEHDRLSWVPAKNLEPGFSFVASPISAFKESKKKNIYKSRDNSCLLSPVLSVTIRCYMCDVYNMEVENDNSYVANNMIVHNCQDYSQAGLQRGGEEGSGTRSSLLWECRRAIEAKRPKYCLQENVAALVSSKFIDQFNKWQMTLEQFGYTNFSKVLNAKDYGVPQNRERIFMVSILGDASFHFPKPVKLERFVKDMLEDNVPECYFVSDDKVRAMIDHCDRKQLEGCGFKFEPTDGGGYAKSITTKSGSRETDNWIMQ